MKAEERRQAIILIRVISNLLAGYLLLFKQGTASAATPTNAHQIDLVRRHFALVQLSLPRDEFPNLIESAEYTAEVFIEGRFERPASDWLPVHDKGSGAVFARYGNASAS